MPDENRLRYDKLSKNIKKQSAEARRLMDALKEAIRTHDKAVADKENLINKSIPDDCMAVRDRHIKELDDLISDIEKH